MKKIYIFTAVLALLTVSLNAQLQARKNVVQPKATERVDTPHNGTAPNRANRDLSVTVGDNSSYTGYVPVYGTWFDSDAGQRNQMIYSSDLLGLPVGAQITSLKFYARGTLGFHSAPVRLSIGHTTASSFTSSSFVSSSDLREVATVTPTTSMTELNFTFSQAFTYNGGNLLIQIDSDKGEYGSTDFYANEQSDYVGIIAYQGYSDNGLTIHDRTRYLPMATFTYMSGSNPSITVSNSNLTFKTAPGETASQTVSITGYNLTEGITATVSGDSEFSVNLTTFGTGGGDLTITYSPTDAGSHSATITLSSPGAEDVTITLNGSCVQEATICDGTDQNNFLPLYGYYYDAKQVNQMIYPADKLTSLVGTKITSMTFYSSHIYFYNGKYTVKVGTTSQTSFSSMARNTADLTATVASDLSATAGGTELTITFDEPFEYNGGNLLVDFEETTSGSWGSSQTSFYGENQSTNTSFNTQGTSLNNGVYTGTNSGLRSFLPKVTFTYINNEPVHDLAIALSEPESVVAGETATITATVTNNGNQTETGYTVTISANGTTISTQTVNEALAPGATATVTAQYSTTAAQGGTTVNIAANVACTDDAEANNDNATASLQVNAQVTDLAIVLSAPASIVGGNTATVTATVTNTGNQPVTGYTVTITDGTNSLLNQTVTETLAPGATATYTADYATTEAQVGNTVNFNATVACTGDADATNNDATASMSVISMPAPENVVATPNDENQSATVTWNAPNITSTSETVVWDFEEEADFNAFTIIDADGDNYNWYYFNSEDAVANSGTGVATSASYVNNASGSGGTALDPDNWLISPEITLGGNLSFYACGQDSDWPSEKFAVYVCVGSYNGTSDFVKIGDYTATAAMTEISVDLSQYEGQGHFAIRHYGMTGNDMFRLNIDDISYSTREDAVFPVSYNIYLDGELVGNVNASDPLSYDFGTVAPGNHTAAVSAVYPGNIESAQVPSQFTIMAKTATPDIDVTPGDLTYTITATGAGTVHMYVDGQEVTQPYEAQRQMNDYTIIVTATAQENGSLISETATREVTIPGLYSSGEWSLMTGTYSGNQPLSLIDSISRKPIMFCDSLAAMTFDNRHPDHYNYQITEVGNEMTSNMVEIPVHKTYSTMYGLYTKEEVDGDTKRTLTANSPNVALSYDIHNADEMYYYALQRSAINTAYPNTDPLKAISKLQESNDKFSEQYDNGVLPKYDDEPVGTIKRVDRYFTDAIGEPGDFETYVPVIWTFGSRTNRRPGQANINNSYGSDIKRNTLGDVNIEIYVEKSNYQATNQSGETVYPGVWPYQGQDYTVFTPKLTITGTPPVKYVANDGDTIVYVPYMFRAWCLYEHPHDFARNSETELLEDRGEIPAADLPLLLGTVYTDQDTCTIGGLWKYGMDRLPWAFGAPVSTQPQDLTFAVRFYYKAIVKDSGKPLFRAANRDGEAEFAEEYLVVEASDNPDQIPTGLDELMNAGRVPVSTTYVNSVGMQSDRPFDGMNIVITRYSDGTTSTVKVMK